MSKAYVDTTILTNILLKPGSKKGEEAKAALARYDETLLPVYAIKEWKKGPLDHYAYVHDKFVQTKSLADTVGAINSLSPYYAPYKKATSYESLESAMRLADAKPASDSSPASLDSEMADRYRLALARLIFSSWQKRRKVATTTFQDLECYTEAKPRLDKDGYVDLKPQKCYQDRECCLADRMKADAVLLKALRDAIPEGSRREEDRNRRKVLKQLINTPKVELTEQQCRWLGDAVFAFFCPPDAVILTTNVRDHKPLAAAAGKATEQP